MAAQLSTKWHDTYSYHAPARPGINGQLSAKLERSPNGWDWQVLKDGIVFQQGYKAGRDDAISDATFYLNQLLREQGASEVIFNPEHWISKDRPKSLSQAMARRTPGRKR
jgi:hypothetical protein